MFRLKFIFSDTQKLKEQEQEQNPLNNLLVLVQMIVKYFYALWKSKLIYIYIEASYNEMIDLSLFSNNQRRFTNNRNTLLITSLDWAKFVLLVLNILIFSSELFWCYATTPMNEAAYFDYGSCHPYSMMASTSSKVGLSNSFNYFNSLSNECSLTNP